MFSGFRKESIQFLKDLKENNNKEWFAANKPVYQDTILQDARDLFNALSKTMLDIDMQFDLDTKQGKGISRIYRDVRFSKDKSPYRTNVWLVFNRKAKDWKESPAYFLDISDSEITYGMGFYTAQRDTMDNLRVYIEENADSFTKLTKDITENTKFLVMGDNYKRMVIPKELPAELQNWYSKKNVYLMHIRKIDDTIYTSEIYEEVKSAFDSIKDIYNLFLDFSKITK